MTEHKLSRDAADAIARGVVAKAQRKVDNMMLGVTVLSMAFGLLNTLLLVAVLLVVVL